DVDAALGAAAAAVAAMRLVPNVIMPFPGGVVRSGSKVGSKYGSLPASTNDAYCPALTAVTGTSALTPEIHAGLEIVIDGLTETDVAAAMWAGMNAVTQRGVEAGIARISAGNYGGKLGPYHFHLRELAGSTQ